MEQNSDLRFFIIVWVSRVFHFSPVVFSTRKYGLVTDYLSLMSEEETSLSSSIIFLIIKIKMPRHNMHKQAIRWDATLVHRTLVHIWCDGFVVLFASWSLYCSKVEKWDIPYHCIIVILILLLFQTLVYNNDKWVTWTYETPTYCAFLFFLWHTHCKSGKKETPVWMHISEREILRDIMGSPSVNFSFLFNR